MPYLLILILALLGSHSTAAPPNGFYDPIERKIEGWLVRIDPRLLQEPNREIGERALARLRWELEGIRWRIPNKRLPELQTVGIWIELDNPHVDTMQYHPGKKWLIKQGMDPRLENFVHIPEAACLTDKRAFHKQPAYIIHELSHGFHHQILGFDYAPIKDAYRKGVAAGFYGKVLHGSGRKTDHYSATNPMEYFAEGCEAYFSTNDYYPFVRIELKKVDPRLYTLMQEIWGK